MSDLPAEDTKGTNDSMMTLNKDLERMTEDMENISVLLTWMAYDMVALRTSPLFLDSLQKLEEAFKRCRAAVGGNSHPEPHEDECSNIA